MTPKTRQTLLHGFLRAEPNPAWSNNLKLSAKEAERMGGQTKAAGIPLAVVLVPTTSEAAMISMRHWPAGFDSYNWATSCGQ
jgi:hypothetical protein